MSGDTIGPAPRPVGTIVEKHERHARWQHQAFLRPGDQDVNTPGIHLDAVAGLGNYFELEGVCGVSDDPAEARLKVETLVEKFRPALGEAVSGSYADL